tara:strand:- start:9521 stop:10306 length:786 start_codon:yes stop_codon:yes gene_type:complete
MTKLDLDKEHIEEQEVYDDAADDTEGFDLPLDIHIGFYSNITEKNVKRHVLAYAEKNFSSLNDVFYQIVKHEDGYLFEIHQGGDAKGYISDYIENSYDDAIIITADNVYRMTPSVHGGVRLVKLTDDDVQEVSKNPDKFDILDGNDNLKALKSNFFGFFVFSSILLFFGVLSVALSATVKYVVVDKNEAVYFTNMNKTFPHEFITDINNEMYQLDLSSEFFKNFYFDSRLKGDKKWSIEKGSILNEEPAGGDGFSDFEEVQ